MIPVVSWVVNHPAAALLGLAVVLAVSGAAIVGITRWGGDR